MRVLYAIPIILALAAAAAVQATPPPFVEESFEGSRFPPTGWTVDGSGDWGWSNPGGYADGYATSTVGHTASCSITSPQFYLDGGSRVRAAFRYVATGYGGAPTDHAIYLRGGGHHIANKLPKTSGWSKYEWLSPFASAYDYFKISWVATVYSPYSSGTGVLRLDDVVITLYNIPVAPTSIGRVRALYR
jgi:hypothetical protein